MIENVRRFLVIALATASVLLVLSIQAGAQKNLTATVVEFSEGGSGASLIVKANQTIYEFCLYGNCGAPRTVLGNVTKPGNRVLISYGSHQSLPQGRILLLRVTKVQELAKTTASTKPAKITPRGASESYYLNLGSCSACGAYGDRIVSLLKQSSINAVNGYPECSGGCFSSGQYGLAKRIVKSRGQGSEVSVVAGPFASYEQAFDTMKRLKGILSSVFSDWRQGWGNTSLRHDVGNSYHIDPLDIWIIKSQSSASSPTVHSQVKANLQKRAEKALKVNGIAGVKVVADGDWVNLTGVVASVHIREKAGDVMKTVEGVRTITNNITVRANANSSWPAFWTQFSNAVKQKNKSALLRLAINSSRFDGGAGGDSAESWAERMVGGEEGKYFVSVVNSGVKATTLRAKGGKITRKHALYFEYVNNRWYWAGVLVD